jgi:RNA-directed DNA polymerase
MAEADAGRRAEMPEDTRRVAGGTRQKKGWERQAFTAVKESSRPEAEALLEKVVRRENLIAALRRVRSNRGAPGIDGMTVEELTPYLQEHWPRVREAILRGSYEPKPVRLVEIPKPDGRGVRQLGIPTALDRFIQQAILQVLTPIFDPHMSDNSYGFRPGRGSHDAIKAARDHVATGCRWVVDIDLEKFFDRVNHDVLMKRVARRVKDKRALRLIGRYLRAGIMIEGIIQAREEGTPQGGPLSPLLSNILLDDLDKELERRGQPFSRYADDCNIYVRSKEAGERVMSTVTRYLWKRLRLRINPVKSAVGRPWERKFLGYTITWHKQPKLKVADASIKRFKARAREVFRKGRGKSLTGVIGKLKSFMLGWINYFRLSEIKGALEQLDEWIRRKLRCILWRQWKKPRTRAKKLMARGIEKVRAFISAYNGRGPWWNAGGSHMNMAIPLKWLKQQGLLSLLEEHKRLQTLA